jgi:hypothetical protein
MTNTVQEFLKLAKERPAGAGAVSFDYTHRKILPAGVDLSDPLLVTGCLLNSYWWGNSPFDRREFVKRKKAGTLYEYKPATLSHVRTEFGRKSRKIRVIFTLTHPNPAGLMTRALWLASALVYVFPDGDYIKKRREINNIIAERQVKCVEKLEAMGEVLPDGVIRQNQARLAG